MQVETIPLTIQLPKPEISFLEDYAKRHRFSIAELIDLYIKQLQLSEQFFASSGRDDAIDAELEQHAGVIPPSVDVVKEYHEYLEEKYK